MTAAILRHCALEYFEVGGRKDVEACAMYYPEHAIHLTCVSFVLFMVMAIVKYLPSPHKLFKPSRASAEEPFEPSQLWKVLEALKYVWNYTVLPVGFTFLCKQLTVDSLLLVKSLNFYFAHEREHSQGLFLSKLVDEGNLLVFCAGLLAGVFFLVFFKDFSISAGTFLANLCPILLICCFTASPLRLRPCLSLLGLDSITPGILADFGATALVYAILMAAIKMLECIEQSFHEE